MGTALKHFFLYTWRFILFPFKILYYLTIIVAIVLLGFVAVGVYSTTYAQAFIAEDYTNPSPTAGSQVVCFSCIDAKQHYVFYKWTPNTSYTLDKVYMPYLKAGANAPLGTYILTVELRSGVTTGSYGTLLASGVSDIANRTVLQSQSTFASTSDMILFELGDVQLNAGTEYTLLTKSNALDTNIRVRGAPSGIVGSYNYADYAGTPNFTLATVPNNNLLFVTIGAVPPVVPENDEISYRFATGSEIFASVQGGVQDTTSPLVPLFAFAGVPLTFIIGRYVLAFITRTV